LAFAGLVGAASAAYVFYYARTNPGFVSDFDQVWAGAVALWRGENPYLVVGPGRRFHWHWPLYYPMPALVLTAPLGLLPVIAARMLFAGLSSALLAFAITRDGFARWTLFISIPFMVNVELVQWSNLLMAAMLLPMLGGIAAAKPNIGLAMVAHTDRARSLWAIAIGAAVLTVVCCSPELARVLDSERVERPTCVPIVAAARRPIAPHGPGALAAPGGQVARGARVHPADPDVLRPDHALPGDQNVSRGARFDRGDVRPLFHCRVQQPHSNRGAMGRDRIHRLDLGPLSALPDHGPSAAESTR
jgi:hypothetical protein